MDQYLHRREQLIAVDRGLRIDHGEAAARYERLADDADSIVRDIRAAEALEVWGPDSNAAHKADDGTHVFPGMGFLTGEFKLIRIMSEEYHEQVQRQRHYSQYRAIQDCKQGTLYQ